MITGAGGLLGSALLRVMITRDIECVGLGKSDLDVTDADAVNRTLQKQNPDVVFHCAAFTAVDRAESEQSSAFSVNRDGALSVALACGEIGARMVFFSTDYVFSGTKQASYSPSDAPDPISSYGRSKLAGETAILASGVEVLLIRTSWLYGSGGQNFLRAIIQRAREGKTLRLVNDQIGSPTWTMCLAEATLDLVGGSTSGIYHITNAGQASWYELGREALSICRLEGEIEPISMEDWGAPASRPQYSVLDSSKAEMALGRSMSPWREALKRFLDEEFE